MKTIALVNQKGGVTKSTSTVNLGVCLAKHGKRVLLVDGDPQGNLTQMLGWREADELSPSLATIMGKVIQDEPIQPGEGILRHMEGVDLMPGNIELSGIEVALVNTMSRETILRTWLTQVKRAYDYILLDCPPSLGMLTINALSAADSVLVPVEAHYLPAKGLEQLLQTVSKVRRQINPHLKIDGILLTKVQRANFCRDISTQIRTAYGEHLRIFHTDIPHSIRAAEMSAAGTSIFLHDPHGKVAAAYESLTKEVLEIGKERRKSGPEILR